MTSDAARFAAEQVSHRISQMVEALADKKDSRAYPSDYAERAIQYYSKSLGVCAKEIREALKEID